MKNILSRNNTNPELANAAVLDELHVGNTSPHFTRPEGNAWKPKRRAFDFRKILVPLTLSRSSHAGLAIARNLARESGTRLILLHVVQLNIAGEERGIHRTRLLNELRRDAQLQLSQLADCLGNDVETEIVVCEGRPAEVIVETARRLRMDAIVMCTHGYRGWLKWLHRNTALNVTRQAPCAVWLVSPRKRDAMVKLMIVDRTTSNNSLKRRALHENPNPFRSLVRVLFS